MLYYVISRIESFGHFAHVVSVREDMLWTPDRTWGHTEQDILNGGRLVGIYDDQSAAAEAATRYND